MAKHCQVEKAWAYFEEAQQKQIFLPTEVYDSLIRVAVFMREANDLRWNFIQELLIKMNQAKLKPKLSTLNAILFTISNLVGSRQAKNYILSSLGEFKNLGIEPSLASYYYILITLCKERKSRNLWTIHESSFLRERSPGEKRQWMGCY